jgi:hypothetical protein
MDEQLTEMERFMRNIRGKEYEQHDQDTQALQEATNSNREYFGREAILEQQHINLENQYQFDVFKKVLTECVGNLYMASLVIDNPELYRESLHEAVSNELNTLWVGCTTSKDIFTLHEDASEYIQEAMKLAESISGGGYTLNKGVITNDTLHEGIVTNAKDKLKDIKANVLKNMAERHKKRTSRLAKEKEDKRKANYQTKVTKQIAGAKYVPKEELIKERDDFKKSFFMILDKYPKLKANIDKSSAMIYEDEFTPLYDYNIVYCDIYGDNDNDTMSDDFEKIFDKFNNELDAIDLKYHYINMEYQCEYYFYQLYNDGDFTIVDPSVSMHESTTIYNTIDSTQETLQEGIIGKLIGNIANDMKTKRAIKNAKRKEARTAKQLDRSEYVPKNILIKERDDFQKLLFKTVEKYNDIPFKKSIIVHWDEFTPFYSYDIEYGVVDCNEDTMTAELRTALSKLRAELYEYAKELKYHELDINFEDSDCFYQLYSVDKSITTIEKPILQEDANTIERIANFEEVNGKDNIGQQIQNRVVDVYKTEEEAGRERKELAQTTVNTSSGVLTESAIVVSMNTFNEAPTSVFHAIFNNRCKQILTESTGCSFNDSKDKVLAETITLYTLLECFNGLGLTHMTQKDEEKLIEEINLA